MDPTKTPVIRRLIDLTADGFAHEVVSINRVSPGLPGALRAVVAPGDLEVMTEPFEYGTAVRYIAPARGVRHETRLTQLGRWLARHIEAKERRPDLIVGHKLTVEGLAVHEAARLTGLPYALSLQGYSDAKIVRARRDLASRYLTILRGASYVFPFSPWSWERVATPLGLAGVSQAERPRVILPCPTDLDQPVPPRVTGSGLVSVWHLHGYRHKNFARLAEAMRLLGSDGPPRLDIIGGGEGQDLAACQRIASRSPAVRLRGAMGRDDVREAMNAASGFVLPSKRETFGLVFIEALFAGAPIVYPAGTAIDGLFDDAPFALRVPANDTAAIAEAMKAIMDNEASMKAALEQWQQSDDARMFQRPQIAQRFSEGLRTAIHRATPRSEVAAVDGT